MKIRLKINRKQRDVFDGWLNTSNYVYNNTVKYTHEGAKINFMKLRDKLVTSNTKKDNVEYKLSEKRTEMLRARRKEHQKLLPNATYSAQKSEIKAAIDALELEMQVEKQSLAVLKKDMKSSRNEGVHDWELETPKEIRAGAVNDVCKAYKTGFANLKLGNIRHFRLGFRKKSRPNKCLLLPKSLVKNVHGKINIAPTLLKESSSISMGKNTIKKHGDIVIDHDCRLVKQRNEYWLIVPVPMVVQPRKPPVNYCGIDPGVKTFMTAFGNKGCTEYKHNDAILRKLDGKIKMMKDARAPMRRRVLKRKINKVEKRKENLINELHWKTIHQLLKHNDFIFYGDIKSHDIVRNGKNRTLNTSMNNLKFFKFKERLIFKSVEMGKQIFETKEHFTTQTCSFCGNVYKPGLSRVYKCSSCMRNIGRDVNAAKNILMKGIVTHIL